MKRSVSLTLLAMLALSQYAALSCPMDLPVGESHDMADAVMAEHRADEPVHENHEDHDDQESCLILMSCGALAVPDLGSTPHVVRLETHGGITLPVASLVSFSADIESPPPRRG